MRQKNDPLPSLEEAREETKKRLRLIEQVRPEFESFCEAMIIVGSMAMGKNYSVRKSSDIDIMLLLERKNAGRIRACKWITMTPKYKEALKYFLSGEIDHFSINTEKLEGVEMQYHFWDKEAHFKAETSDYTPRVYNVWRTEGEPVIRGVVDLEGKEYETSLPLVKKCAHGVIHNYPAKIIIDGKIVYLQSINNLISDSDIVFCKDKRLFSNIKIIWKNIAKEFITEKIPIDKENPLKFIPGNWSFSPKSRKRVEERFRQALRRLYNVIKEY